MPKRQPPLPTIWLVSDVRNDAALEATLRRLPRGSGLVYRHYHLSEAERRRRFEQLRQIVRRRGHVIVVAGSDRLAMRWGADGSYGSVRHGPVGLRLTTAHSLRELRRAGQADAVLLSPVFATRSHPGAASLGTVRFRLLARRSPVPVIALGGMNRRNCRRLGWPRWAAVDGLS